MLPKMISPVTARQARLLRVANRLSTQGVPGAPKSIGDKLVWVHSHARKQDDVTLSQEEERLRERKVPLAIDHQAIVAHTTDGGENMYQYRDFPMFPGEYIPPQHNTLSSIRDDLQRDMTAQSLKEAWMRVSGGQFFDDPKSFYARADGLDEIQLGEIVSALFPDMGNHESRALVRKVLELLSRPDNTPSRKLSSTITAESLGLDRAPGHYTNFMQWMARYMDTKAFATEHAIFQFCRRKFNRKDVQEMYENYILMSPETLANEQSDSYSHFYAVLKDFHNKIASTDSRHQLGVRIDPAEVDMKTGFSFGYGFREHYHVLCMIRKNEHGKGRMFANGTELNEYMAHKSYNIEQIVWPFYEAGLNPRDFDVYFKTREDSVTGPAFGEDFHWIFAARPAVAMAIAKQIPIKRIPLKKSGLLSADLRQRKGDFVGFLNKRRKRRYFSKRA